MTPEEVIAFRQRFGINQVELAKFLAVINRTVCRWEHGDAKVSSSGAAIMGALNHVLDNSTALRQEEVILFVRDSIRIGGLGPMLIELMARVP